MRTPKGSRPRDRGAKAEVNKLRKRAMKNKMMKKTMLALSGDDTKDEIRDLMNDSGNLSSISIIGRSPAQAKQPANKTKPKSPGRKKVTKSESSLSLKALSAQLSRRTSRRKLKETDSPRVAPTGIDNSMEVLEVDTNNGEAMVKHGDTIKVMKMQNGQETSGASNQNGQAAAENGHSDEMNGQSRLESVKNLFTSAVWGVPYAKVVEDSEGGGEHNATQTSQSQESRCIIS